MFRILSLISIFAVLPVAASASPKEPIARVSRTDVVASILPDYQQIHAALIKDSLDGVHEGAKAISKKTKSGTPLNQAAERLASAQNLDDARKAFKDLSGPVVAWTEKNKPAGLNVMYCPMAKAKWVQKGDAVQNPYYGAEMRECGEKQ